MLLSKIMKQKVNQKRVVLGLLIVLVFFGYYVLQFRSGERSTTTKQSSSGNSYTNSAVGFQLRYLSNWFYAGGGAFAYKSRQEIDQAMAKSYDNRYLGKEVGRAVFATNKELASTASDLGPSDTLGNEKLSSGAFYHISTFYDQFTKIEDFFAKREEMINPGKTRNWEDIYKPTDIIMAGQKTYDFPSGQYKDTPYLKTYTFMLRPHYQVDVTEGIYIRTTDNMSEQDTKQLIEKYKTEIITIRNSFTVQ